MMNQKHVRKYYIGLWLCSICAVGCLTYGNFNPIKNESISYIAQLICIVVTLSGIYVVLKLVKGHRIWQWTTLAIALLVNVTAYGLFRHHTFLYFIAMTFIASLLSYPKKHS